MRSLYMTGLSIPTFLAIAGVAIAQPLDSAYPIDQQAQAPVILAPSQPPPPRDEPPPPPPTTTTTVQIWETGHWAWNGTDWVWAHGQYVVRPPTVTTTAIWHPGHWIQQPNGWLWVEGHWE